MTALWTGLDSEDANVVPADLDRKLATKAFKRCRTFTNADRGVFVNFPKDDEAAAAAVAAAFGRLGFFRGFVKGGREWWDVSFPARFYDEAVKHRVVPEGAAA